MDRTVELGAFLRSRRARLSPDDMGLVGHGGRRRVPGLRREELAQLAGISVGYYTRLEQGIGGGSASDAVLEALARVLRLDGTERAHLYGLARPARQPARGGDRPEAADDGEQLRPSVRNMIESLGDVPALVLGRFVDVLAWNRAGHALLAGHLPFDAPERSAAERPNIARMMFLDPHTRALYPDRQSKLRDTVGDLRLIAGRWPDSPRPAGLIAELGRESAEFATLWAAHPVRTCATHTRAYRHPVVGPLTLTDELLTLPDDPGQRVVIYHAEPGSPSAAALRLLAATAAAGRLTVPPRRT
ncbi:XRE family transcriptional regulator [Streptomyces inhibens]|uniref:XRE family transcriptional regulator n=1 Tax=Streptomyces inhibens TaxID=2293571 RepID=A0A371Q9C6_STRIH|nr:helix-turn-helix transcriptional regulator [Streptomyces inhibens]REK91264.1 XRE family transcriptional regulator [Streptomyces inhibens]